MQRIQKLLSSYGYCSRRGAEELIKEGRVKVNGRLIKLGDSAAETDSITVDDKKISGETKVYLLFNKPVGCVTALTDEKFKTVMDYIKIREGVFPVGRLDYNTCGLLLLTNDGDFANNVMHPRYNISKTYLVGITRPMTDGEKKVLEKGVMLEDGKTSPAKIKVHSPEKVEITIHEGKKHIVRRMFEKLDIPIKFLMRVKVGKLALGWLKPGQFRFLHVPYGKDPIMLVK